MGPKSYSYKHLHMLLLETVYIKAQVGTGHVAPIKQKLRTVKNENNHGQMLEPGKSKLANKMIHKQRRQ